MSNYKCIRSFTSYSNEHFTYGTKINSSKYSSLRYSDRTNFTEETEEASNSGYSSDNSSSDYIPPSPSFDFGSISNDSSSSDSSFGGFDGGSDGGGGADSGW